MSIQTIRISQRRGHGKFHLVSTNAHGAEVETDGSPAIGGAGHGARPMELVLMALGSCSTIDVVLILEKQRQTLDDIKVEITAEREQLEKYSEYRKIHLDFTLNGQIKPEKARKAIDLSIKEYCSVAMLLRHTAEITYDFSIISSDET